MDFRLTEECLLNVMVEVAGGEMKEMRLQSKELPETLKRALAERAAVQAAAPAQAEPAAADDKGGLFSSLKRMLGRG